MANEVANLFINGGKKYDDIRGGDTIMPLLLIGKSGTTSIHGKKQSMATKSLKALRRTESEGRLVICWVNGNFTSKVCWQCHSQNSRLKEVWDTFTGSVISLWDAMECTICGHNWDRNINAANNIRYLGHHEYGGLDRPDVFTRRTKGGVGQLQSLLALIDESLNANFMAPDNIDPIEIGDQVTPSQQLNAEFTILDL